jgi:hypothetical protein
MAGLQAMGDARGRQRLASHVGRGRDSRMRGGCRERKCWVRLFFCRGQYRVWRVGVIPVLVSGRLARDPPFLLGRRCEGELPLQL